MVLSTLLHAASASPSNTPLILELLSRTVAELKTKGLQDEEPVTCLKVCRPLLLSLDSLVCSSTLRVIRHILVDGQCAQALINLKMHLFIVRFLYWDSEPKSKKETFSRIEQETLLKRVEQETLKRIEGMKVLRRIMDVNVDCIHPYLARSIICIASTEADPLRGIALEIVRMISYLNFPVLAKCGGIRAIVQGITSHQEMSKALCVTLLFLLENESTRQYFRILDITPILSPFTEENEKKWDVCQQAFVLLLKSWTGLFFFASDKLGLQSLVQVLVQPVSLGLRIKVLETITLIFRSVGGSAEMQEDDGMISGDEGFVASTPGMGPHGIGASELLKMSEPSEHMPGSNGHDVLSSFLASLLLAFAECGLVDALTEVVTRENPPFAQDAAHLLAFIKRCAMRLLPESLLARYLFNSTLVMNSTFLTRTDPAEKLQARRSVHILGMFSTLDGFGYSLTASTLLGHSADTIALASDLSLAAASILEQERENTGVMARPAIGSMPFAGNIIASKLIENVSGLSQVYNKPDISKAKRKRDMVIGSIQLLSKAKRNEKKVFENADEHQKVYQIMVEEYLDRQDDSAGRALVKINDSPLATTSNRGHRRHVRGLMCTEEVYSDVSKLYKMVNRSKVLQGKLWSEWDWGLIDQIVCGFLRNNGLLSEIIKTKFVKRVLGFFRATNAGEFVKLPYCTKYQKMTIIGKSLIRILLETPEGVDMLENDRRGKLHIQIIDALVLERDISDINDGLISKSYFEIASDDSERIFSPTACSFTMTRDLFSLLGAYSTRPDLLLEQGFFETMTTIATDFTKDYLTHLIVVNLDYQASIVCREWLLSLSQISNEIQLSILSLIRGFLRRGSKDPTFARWCLSFVYRHINDTDILRQSSISILNEFVYIPDCLRLMDFDQLSELLNEPNARPIFLKLAGTNGGVTFLDKHGWISDALQRWSSEHCVKYAARLETLLNHKLLCKTLPLSALPKCYAGKSDDVYGAAAATRYSNAHLLSRPVDSIPQSVPVLGFPIDNHEIVSSDILSLQRLPFRIEVWIEIDDHEMVFIPVHSYLDCSRLSGPEYGSERDEPTYRENLVVKAVPLNSCFLPQGKVAAIHAAITFGGELIKKDGSVVQQEDPHSFTHPKFAENIFLERGSVFPQTNRKTRFGTTLCQPFNGCSRAPWVRCQPKTVFEDGQLFSETHQSASFFFQAGPHTRLRYVSFGLKLKPLCPNAPPLPTHLYGQLARTEKGQVHLGVGSPLQTNFDPPSLVDKPRGIVSHLLEQILNKSVTSLERRASLCALGHIGSSELGMKLLLDKHVFIDVSGNSVDIVRVVIDIAIHSASLCLRGAAIQALGLMGISKCGLKKLQQNSWDARGGTALPKGTLFTLKTKTVAAFGPYEALAVHEDPVVAKALKAVSDSSNRILIRQAFVSLEAMKDSPCFLSPKMLVYLHQLLGSLFFDALARQKLLDFFHTRVSFEDESSWEEFDECI